MTRTATTLAAATAMAALALPGAALAHVTVQPPEATPRAFTVMHIRVPNERDDKGTTKVDVRMPDGFNFVSYQKVAGWNVKITRAKLDKPVEIEPGFEVDEQITRVTFTGDGRQGIIEPGQFQDFPLSVRVPDGKAGSKLTFKALQTYKGGEIVRWIGAPDADEPAPQVTLANRAKASGGAHGANTTPAAAATSSSDEGGGGTDGFSIAALIVGGLGLVAGLVGVTAARRAGQGRRAATAHPQPSA